MRRWNDPVGLHVEEAAAAIVRGTGATPRVGVILGTGQGGLSRRLSAAGYLSYGDIPHFYRPSVPGHDGVFGAGILAGVPTAVLEGKIHLHEGYFMREVVFPVRVLHRLGVRDLVICCAAGGLDPSLGAGQIMVVRDHLNLTGSNPLVGQVRRPGADPFVAMDGAYDDGLRRTAVEAGREAGEELREGVLAGVTGPSYETPAERRMLALLGADAVTMSAVPEAIMARFLGMRILGLAMVTNSREAPEPPDHGRVFEVAAGRIGFLAGLVERVVERIGRSAS